MQRGMMRKEMKVGIIVFIAMIALVSCTVSGALNPAFTINPTSGNVTVTTFTFANTSTPDEAIISNTLYFDSDDISGFGATWRYNVFPFTSTTRVYPQDGSYNVTLEVNGTVPGPGSTDIVSTTLDVYPEADFTTNSTGFAALATNQDVAFVNDSVLFHPDVFYWGWLPVNGHPHDSTEDTVHHFSNQGQRGVNFTVVNTFGLQDSLIEYFYVWDKPVADFNITPPAGTDVPLAGATTNDGWGNFTQTTFNLNDQSIGANYWLWYVYPEGSSMGALYTIDENPTIAPGYFTFDGVYEATHYANNTTLFGGLSDPVTHKIYITPYANFSTNLTSTNVAVGKHIQFTDESEIFNPLDADWCWKFDSGNPADSTDQNPVAAFTTAGSHVASLNLTNTTSELYGIKNVTFTVADLPHFTFTNTTLLEGVMPLTVGFAATNTGSTTVDTWNWQFSDGGSPATGQNVLHTFASAGTYTVSLTGTNNTYAGATRTNSTDFTITGKTGLSVDFTRSPVMGIYPLAVNFTPTVTGDGAKVCNWTFNDGTPVTTTYGVMNVTHTFNGPLATARYYNVTLNVTTPYATAQKTMTNCVQVGIPVAANFTFTPSSGVAPILVSFADTSLGSAIDEWYWKFEGAVPPDESTLKEPDVTYQHGGVYRVNLTATSTYFANSNTTSRLITIPEHLAPVANFTATPSREIAPGVISFDASGSTGTPPMTYTWNFDDQSGTAPQNSPYVTHTYNTPREYLPTLIVTNAYGSNSTARPVSIGQRIVPDFSYTIDPQPNGEWPVQFIDESSGSYDHWFWKFGDGGTSTEQDPLHTYYNTASYNVNLTVSSDYYGRSASVNKTVVIDKKPVARFSASPKQGETPLTVSFVDESGGLEISGWLWNFGNGDTSNLQNVDYTYTTTGPYEVTLTVTNPYGTDTSPITTIYPYEKLVAAFTADPNLGVKPLDVTFTDSSLGAPDQWFWEFGDLSGFEGQNPPVHTYYQEGQYVVNLTVYKNRYLTDEVGLESVREESIGAEAAIMDRTSRTVTVTETAPPDVSFIALTPITGTSPLTVSFQDTTGEGFKPVEWLWEFGDGAMSTVQNPTHTYEKPGMYTVALNVKNAAGISRAANPVFIAVTEAEGFFGAADAENIESAPSAEEPGVNETVNETASNEEP